jgi:hypothetical protein
MVNISMYILGIWRAPGAIINEMSVDVIVVG